MRTSLLPNLPADPLPQRLVQYRLRLEPHEQDYPHIGLPVLPHHQALDDFRQLFYLAIDLRGPDPYAAGVERCVTATVNHDTVVRGELGPVPMTPDAREPVEVSGSILRAIGVVPKLDRHAGERSSADQFTGLLAHRHPVRVVDFHGHTQTQGLQLAPPDRRDGIAEGKAGYNVGATADACEVDIRFDVPIDVIEAVPGERAPGGQHGPERRQAMSLRRRNAFLLGKGEVFGAGSEDRNT